MKEELRAKRRAAVPQLRAALAAWQERKKLEKSQKVEKPEMLLPRGRL